MTDTTVVVVEAESESEPPAGELAHEIAEHAEQDVDRAHDQGVMLGRLITMVENVQERLGILEYRTEAAQDTADVALDVAIDAAGDAAQAVDAAATAEVVDVQEVEVEPAEEEPDESPDRTHFWWK